MLSRLRQLVLSTLVTAAGACPAQAVPEQGYVLEQFSETTPTHINYLTAHAFKSKATIGGFTVISKAPDWKVTVFNDKSKVYWEVPLSQFKGEMAARVYASERADLMRCKWQKKKEYDFLGEKTVEYATTGTGGDDKANPRGKVYNGFFLSLPVERPPEIYALLAKLYQLPTLPGIPLRMEVNFKMLGQLDHVKGLNTRKLTKTILTDKEFAPPSDYRQVFSESEVFLDPASKAALSEFTKWTDPGLEKKHQ